MFDQVGEVVSGQDRLLKRLGDGGIGGHGRERRMEGLIVESVEAARFGGTHGRRQGEELFIGVSFGLFRWREAGTGRQGGDACQSCALFGRSRGESFIGRSGGC